MAYAAQTNQMYHKRLIHQPGIHFLRPVRRSGPVGLNLRQESTYNHCRVPKLGTWPFDANQVSKADGEDFSASLELLRFVSNETDLH